VITGPIPGSCVEEGWGFEELIPDGRGVAFVGLVIADGLGDIGVEETRGADRIAAWSGLDLQGIVTPAGFNVTLVLLDVGELGVPDRGVYLRWSDCGVLGPVERGVWESRKVASALL
jgi:hypothetical protein